MPPNDEGSVHQLETVAPNAVKDVSFLFLKGLVCCTLVPCTGTGMHGRVVLTCPGCGINLPPHNLLHLQCVSFKRVPVPTILFYYQHHPPSPPPPLPNPVARYPSRMHLPFCPSTLSLSGSINKKSISPSHISVAGNV
jgi:hypothetical protein